MKTLFENDITIAVVVKNEAMYIGEWLEYHYKIGIDKIYLYDNDSEDRAELMKVLEPWIQKSFVEYNELPGDYAQLPAYQDAVHRHRFDCKYMAFIDVDEFIVPKKNLELLEIVDQAFEMKTDSQFLTAALCANWRMFGSNGHLYRESGGVLERFPRRLKDDFYRNLVVKSITNPRRINYCESPHCPQYHINCIAINENGSPVAGHKNTENTVEKIQINHYFTKSKEEFIQKMSRGRSDCYLRYDEATFTAYDTQDEIEDLTALEIFRRPIIRREKIVDDDSTIRDLEFMLGESEHNLEQLLTCFHRANGLKNSDLRLDFLSRTSKIMFQMSYFQLCDLYMLFDVMPEIIAAKTAFTKYFIEMYSQISLHFEQAIRQNLFWSELDELRKRREIIKSFA